MKKVHHISIAVLVAGLVAAIGFGFWSAYDLISLEKIIYWVEMARTYTWISAAFYLVYIFGVMFLPITLFPIVGGVLFPFWAAFPMNVAATTTGGWIAFCLTRRFGRKAAEPFLKRHLKSLDRFSTTQGFKTVLLLRLLGVPPYVVSNYALGLSGVKHLDFIVGTMIGILPWTGIVTYLSGSLWESVLLGGRKGLTGALAHALGPLSIVSAMVFAVIALGAYLKRRQAPSHHSNL